MKNIDLENFYGRIERHISTTAAHLNNNNLTKLIKSCRLKPYSAFDGSLQKTGRFERHWVDEFGNSLKFKNKVPHIILNDLMIKDATKTSTDLFYGNSIRTVSQNSKAALVASGTNELSRDIFIVSFYGSDEYLRSFMFIHSAWIRISPLLLGMQTLNKFCCNINIATIRELDKELLDFIIPMKVDKCITTFWPAKQGITSCFENKTLLNAIL